MQSIRHAVPPVQMMVSQFETPVQSTSQLVPLQLALQLETPEQSSEQVAEPLQSRLQSLDPVQSMGSHTAF